MEAPTWQFQRTSKTREQSTIFEAGLCFVLYHIGCFNLKNGHLTQQSTVLPANEVAEFSPGKAMDMMRIIVRRSLSAIIVNLIQFAKTTKCWKILRNGSKTSKGAEAYVLFVRGDIFCPCDVFHKLTVPDIYTWPPLSNPREKCMQREGHEPNVLITGL